MKSSYDHLHTLLCTYGMSSAHASIYLTVLEYGSIPASRIAARTGIKRSTVYMHLNTMIAQQRILAHENVTATTLYSAVEPTTLYARYTSLQTEFAQSLDQFSEIQSSHQTHTISKTYHGIQGLKRLYSSILDHPDSTIYALSGIDTINSDVYKYLVNHFVPERLKRNITAKVLLPFNHHDSQYTNEVHEDALHNIRFIQSPEYKIFGELLCIGEHTVIQTTRSGSELFGSVIHSKSLYQSLRSVFQVLRADALPVSNG